jgi:hypothetical protein
LVLEKGTKLEEFSKYAEIIINEGWEPKYLILGDYKAGLVLYEKEGKLTKVKAMPPLGDKEDSMALLIELKKYFKKNYFFYNYIIPDRYIGALDEDKIFYKCEFSTITIDLSISLEEIWKNLDKDARWGVNKAKKEGAEIILAKNKKDFEEFYKIYLETSIRGQFFPETKSFLEELYSSFSEYNQIFLVRFKEKIIAGAWIKFGGPHFKIPKLEYNASLSEHLNIQPNNLLYWYIIEWAKKNNFPEVDLGGIEPEAKEGTKFDSLNKFKSRWGGKQKNYFILTSSFIYSKFLKSSKKMGFLSRIILSLIK